MTDGTVDVMVDEKPKLYTDSNNNYGSSNNTFDEPPINNFSLRPSDTLFVLTLIKAFSKKTLIML